VFAKWLVVLPILQTGSAGGLKLNRYIPLSLIIVRAREINTVLCDDGLAPTASRVIYQRDSRWVQTEDILFTAVRRLDGRITGSSTWASSNVGNIQLNLRTL
jgi:hypothetical protein